MYPTSWPAKASFQRQLEEHGDIKCFWRSGWFFVTGRSGVINLLINFSQHLMTCLTSLIQLCGSELMQNIWQEDWKMALVCSGAHYFNSCSCFYWKLLNYLVKRRSDYYMSYAAKAKRKLSLQHSLNAVYTFWTLQREVPEHQLKAVMMGFIRGASNVILDIQHRECFTGRRTHLKIHDGWLKESKLKVLLSPDPHITDNL